MSLNKKTPQNKTKDGKEKTPSFVMEVPLRVTRTQAKTIHARMEAGRQMYNALLGEALKRLRLMRESKIYQVARSVPKDKAHAKERASAFAAARTQYGFTEYQLSQYATKLRQSWLEDHIGSQIAQKLVNRAFDAALRVAVGKSKKVRFKSQQRGIHSLEGKSNKTNLVWRDDHVEWAGLSLPMVQSAYQDEDIQYGLSKRVKYVRIVRRNLRGTWRFYAQLVCEGVPYVKSKHIIGEETVGLDIGPSSIAIVGQSKAELRLFAEEVVRDHKHIRRLQRKLGRQRRANNPNCYDELGRSIKGKRSVKKSHRQAQTQVLLQELFRREAEHRKTLHGQMANQVLAIGKYIQTEDLSFRTFQKRYGKSIGVRGPKTFLTMLKRKAESAGGHMEEFSTVRTALSQVCICEKRRKKRLSERVHSCECGVLMQRDLFSAYLATYVEQEELQAAKALSSWQGAEPLLRTAWRQATNQPASGRRPPSSFGAYRSQSGSSEKESLPKHEAQDAVAKVTTFVRACESVQV